MRLDKVSVILFLGFLVVVVVSVNVILYTKLQYKETFSDNVKLITLEVRSLEVFECLFVYWP